MEKLKKNSVAYEMVIKKATKRMDLDFDVNKALNQVNGIIKEIAAKEVGFIRRKNKPCITVYK